MQQKVIWFILFLIVSGLTFYWVVIRESELNRYKKSKEEVEELSGVVTEAREETENLDVQFIGRGKHIKEFQKNLTNFKEEYAKKMKDIQREFDNVENNINKAKEQLKGLIESVEEDLDDLEDKHKSLKKSTNRKIKDIEYKIIPPIKSELKGLGDNLMKIIELELIQEEIKKAEENSNNSSNPN